MIRIERFFSIGVMNMRTKLWLLFFAILLICISFYYIINQSTEDPLPQQDLTNSEENEILEDIEEPSEDHEETMIEEKVPLKDRISNALRDTFSFIFTQEFHVVAIGDSLTQGVGDGNKNGGYIGILDDTINAERKIVTFENFGKSGRRTDQLLEVLNEPEIISSIAETDIVLITIGANDIMKVVRENFIDLTFSLFIEEQIHFEQRLNDIFINIKRMNPDAHIYLLGLYNPFKQYFQEIEELDLIVERWNQTGENVTAKYPESTFIPIKDLFDETAINLFADDHFHPNEFGYEKMAGRVLEYLADGE